MTPQKVAQELDMDDSGTQHRYFESEFFETCEKDIDPPLLVGRCTWNPETYEIDFIKSPNGNVKLWIPLDAAGRPPQGRYCFGGDVATGKGGVYSSNSTIIGIDLTTRSQMLEFADSNIKPDDYAEFLVALAKWFHGAMVGWEHAGPGCQVTDAMVDLPYTNMYYREVLWKGRKKSQKAVGWHPSKSAKAAMFKDIDESGRKQKFVIRSQDLLDECGQYIFVNGSIEHSNALATDIESAKGQNHGDRVIGWGVAIQCAKSRPLPMDTRVGKQTGQETGGFPPGTAGYRLAMAEMEDEMQLREMEFTDDITVAHGHNGSDW